MSKGVGRLLISVVGVSAAVAPAGALPPPTDRPEEVLRTEIITDARSPVDGAPVTAAQYAELQTQIQTPLYPPTLGPIVRRNVRLLQLRQAIRSIFPFLLR